MTVPQAPTTVILWVHPRSCSTMFEQSVLQRPKEFKVLHEPMGDAYYFGPEKVSNRFDDAKCSKDYAHFADSTFKKTWDNIIKHNSPSDPPRTFSKDMAQYIFAPTYSSATSVPSFSSTPTTSDDDDNPTLIPTSTLLSPSTVHTFLIRTPTKAIPSYHRLCYPGAPTDFDYFDPEEAGYREVRALFDFIKKAKGRTPLVLDSEDLLKSPEEVMKIWCKEVGVEFDKGMLQWDEGVQEHFAKWPGWHESAQASTGMGKGLKDHHITPSNHASGTDSPKPDHPQIVKDAIEANIADYEYLKKFVVKHEMVEDRLGGVERKE
ncbi:hypothetical protein BCR35DRAFT_320083 [Leucosporidium creatinivorum]|uniref:P-loop containing nucleoside triphosphate hydrolase protein n=1 Tax=Leucosporidium creatinivorum TaxID=106004 RepID=A0A1Y2G8P9_9BASI|nr:hypothetical protein BCR35DRAFT_320083 [Leucosporidium creatinivorum]